jgi:predicted esterase
MTSTKSVKSRLYSLLLASYLIAAVPFAFAASRTAHCGAIKQHYVFYAPESSGSPQGLPVVLLLHGAGDIADNMIDAWKNLAKKNSIILLAPQLPRDPKFEDSAPKVFRCVVEDARQSLVIDSSRIFVFGNSMGGYLAFDAAMFESNYFAAVAVHGMKIADDYAWIVDRAARKTPISIYIGDHDQFHSAESVQKTRDLLRKAGFPVRYVELCGHDHNYYAIADHINQDAWQFFVENPLPK